jgi:hypothetical protein
MLSHTTSLSLTGDDQAVLSLQRQTSGGQNVSRKHGRKILIPPSTSLLYPAFPILCLLSILLGALTLCMGHALGMLNFDSGLRDRKGLSQTDQYQHQSPDTQPTPGSNHQTPTLTDSSEAGSPSKGPGWFTLAPSCPSAGTTNMSCPGQHGSFILNLDLPGLA